jgi:uncharacterized repeat protein (TIGR03803 family)
MQNKRRAVFFATTFAVVLVFLTTVAPAFAAGKEKVLHRFGRGKDGSVPWAGLIFDAVGNLYGVTLFGGSSSNCGYELGCGTAFQLAPGANGKWTEKLLHDFQGRADGGYPNGPLISDAAGNLYGSAGGGGNGNCQGGCGVVFELTPGAKGRWTEKVLYNFPDYNDGYPKGPLTFDAAGNLYGTAIGEYTGNVFELTPGANGQWTQTVLYQFNGGSDGDSPYAGVVLDAAGNLYGTTYYGGGANLGTVFKLAPGANGGWTETVLHSFCAADGCTDGGNPYAGVVLDAAGNLYGNAEIGGTGQCKNNWGFVIGCGTVFELTPGADGKWTEKVLHNFRSESDISTGLTFDTAGELYGTVYFGAGVFKMTPGGNGRWTYRVVHRFSAKDGGPSSGVIFDAAGNLYGTTEEGAGSGCGPYGCGTVFEITP